jgi:exportin-2 (importin alpha re-exporter)
MATGIEERHDKLATDSIKFLASLAKNQYYNHLFEGDQILTNMCQKIVIPNVIVRESDEELFEDNPTDFIRRDIEGSDSSTRRRCSIDLMRSLCKHGGDREKAVTSICFNFMQTMLQDYNADRSKWALKDSTVALVIALASRAYTAQGNVSMRYHRVAFCVALWEKLGPP